VVQSSSTVTSVIVGLVAGGLDVGTAIPMIMGANIGTTVTNTLVSMAHVARPTEFRRAFSAATIHDCFNLLAVLIFLPLEIMTGFLAKITTPIAEGLMGTSNLSLKSLNFVKPLTKPVIDAIGKKGILEPLGDKAGGIILALLGLILIFAVILYLGKLLRAVLVGRAERIFHASVGRGPVAGIASGTVITVLVQSSSTTTSLIVPMAGAGLLSLEKVFAFTLGANIGTTVTALLASTAASSNAAAALQIALIHFCFNMLSVLLIFGIPAMRRIPLKMADMLADLAIRSKLAAIGWIVMVYFLIPLAIIWMMKANDETVDSETGSEPTAITAPAEPEPAAASDNAAEAINTAPATTTEPATSAP
jgi:sodium-dependent phosphate cotransporter